MSKNNQNVQSIKKSLQEKGFRLTKERKIIIETLMRSERYLTIDELYLRIAKSAPVVSRATIYRSLKILVEQELISQINPGRQSKSYFGATAKNCCFCLCRNCGKIENICPKPKGLKYRAQKLTNYKILSYQVEFVGVCPKCKKAI